MPRREPHGGGHDRSLPGAALRRALALAAAAISLLVPAGPAGAAERLVTIPGRFFEPKQVVVLVGDSVVWRNDDSATHDVEADDGSFGSGELEGGQSFAFTFANPGSYSYVCTIHRFMDGRVDVFGLALFGPERPVAAGRRVFLRGLAPAEAGSVTIERFAASGRTVPVANVGLAADGSFRVPISPAVSRRYRAVAGDFTSKTVAVTVGARLELSARRARGRVAIRVHASPRQRGATVVLERYARELFDWVPLRRDRLDRRSSAQFRIDPRRPLHLRAVIERGVRGYGPATSRTIVVRPV